MNRPRASIDAPTFNVAEEFAKFTHDFAWSRVPSEVIARAKLSILDALGIGLASSNYPFASATAEALAEIGGDGEFPVLGMARRYSQRDAAHLIGTLIHGLDFDDTHSESIVHTSASTVPTILTAGLATGASGRRALEAFIIGSESASRIGAAARGGFHNKGFHPTGVVGAFACVLACGHLYGLDQQQLRHAQGIVLSKAAGSLQFLDDGAWTKRNHPGWSSVCAQTAVAMARHGFIGPRDPYCGRYGLYPLYTHESGEIQYSKLTEALGTRWEIMNIAFKPYPACHMAHAFVDAILAVKHAQQLELSDIERIVAYVHEQEIPVICEPVATKIQPQNSYDAQFSVNYVIAAAFIRERFGLRELDQETLCDPQIAELCRKVSYTADPHSAYPDYFSGAIDVHTHAGACFHHREQHNRGSAANPMSRADIEKKFLANAREATSAANAHAIMDLVLHMEEQQSLSPLAERLAGN